MYQQYRHKKQKSSSGAKVLAIVFVLAVLIGGLWYLPKLGKKVETAQTPVEETKTTSITDGWYVGKKIALSGDISSADNQIAYTHTIQVWEEKIKAFSSIRDLSSYNGKVYIQATVAKFDMEEFIIDIDAIGTSETDLATLSLPSSTSTRIVPAIALKIDMSNRSDITYTASGSSIYLQAENMSGTVKIDGFRCEAWFPEKDCDSIEKTFGEGFVSAWWMTYKKWDNNAWFARNSAGAWYLITADGDALLYKVSSVLIPINENYIKNLLPQAQKLCTSLASVTKNTISKTTLSTWKMALEGKATNGQAAQCSLWVTFTESGESITVEKQVWGATPTTPTTPGTTTPVAPNTGNVAPVVTASWLTFTSSRGGYSIFYPSAKISYNSVNVQEDLGIDKLNCYIRIDVKSYADRDNDAVGPWVSLYECTSKAPSSTISDNASWYIFKTSKDGSKLFLIKTQNAAWASFAGGIKIE